jgi:hypothetical protein
LLNGTPSDLAMYCDDWADNINNGQTWYVQGTALSAITGANPATDNTGVYFGSDTKDQPYNAILTNYQLTQKVKYIAAVDLAVQISQLSGPDGVERGELSLALWDIFNPNLTSDGQNDNTLMDTISIVDLTNAIDFARGYTDGSIGGYTATIWTPLLSGDGSYNLNGSPAETLAAAGGIAISGTGVPQEFIQLTSVPEPSAWAVLAFDFAGAGLAGLYFLRRKSRIKS